MQNLVGNSEETHLEETSRGKCPYRPLQIVNPIPFCLFALYLYPLSAPFLNPLSSPFFTSDQFFVQRLQFITFCSPMAHFFLHTDISFF